MSFRDRPLRSPRRAPLGLALLSVLSLTPSLALADAATDAAGTTDARTLDKVRVVAAQATPSSSTRLPITLQETPQSTSVIGLERLQSESLYSINDVMRNVTGVNVSFYDTQRPLYYARGFTITDFQVDGLPTYSGSTNQEYDTAFYDRIEVIRGANGLLSGAGIPSATVNLLRKRPGREFDASFAISAGSWDFRRMEADVNAPLTADGRFRSRVVAAYQDRDYYYDRYTEDKMSGMAVLEGDLTDSTTVTVGYQRQDNNPVGSTWGTVPFFNSDGSFAHLPRETNMAPKWTRWQRETSTAFANLEQTFGENWMLRVNAAHTEGNVQNVRVYGSGYPDPTTGSGVTLMAGAGDAEDTRNGVDVFLSGSFALFGREHDVVVGGSWSDLESTTWTLTPVNTWRYDIPNLYTWDGDIPELTASRTGARRVQRTTQSGVYASTRLRLADPLSLIAGARLSRWETLTRAYNTRGAYTATSGQYKVTDEVTPYVGLVYEILPALSVYASYTEIFNPQNFKDRNENLLAPVQGSNLEAGIKSQWFDGRLTANAAIFEAKQDNYAVRDMTQPDGSLSDGSSAYVGVNGTKSRGWEVDVNGQILPGWTVNAGYTHVKVTRAATDLIYANLPEDFLQLNTTVQLSGALERLSLGGGFSWQSRVRGYNIPYPLGGTVTVNQPAYMLVNLNANYRISDNWMATLSVRNALDKTYWANLDYNNYGEPRFVSASLRWKF
ncbi:MULTISPECIES: TonB-dependent siderophore receptor [unclassified Stenotrophomonas]|jgi:outer membrane receptor for ferric coprogen and ferric-rhodotorulic acid|uniref:TonB-dependent siderophore receptor n=1 Tax=unclassified Stenotrophomonas TaxID=196198 RepID=UPI00131057BA|nr:MULTISPECIES: TonB-dependent siderophore receptor [unclassified Stenotrophomonas]MBD3827419.1 TonB-dependent siderophore receptor [Stenotrophomonas sp.]QIO87359.1 ligand-gated channel [Stenotrophomonas rhizophila]